jgi:hypothetical protein
VLEAWSVVQLIVAELEVIPVDVTAVITGPGDPPETVVNVKFVDAIVVPDPLPDRTA